MKQPKLMALLEETTRMESFLVSKRYLETIGESDIVEVVWLVFCCVCELMVLLQKRVLGKVVVLEKG